MPTVRVDVDLDLDEINDDELVAEVRNRINDKSLDKRQLDELRDALGYGRSGMFSGETLDTVLKKELFEEALNKFTIIELSERLK